jgi:hypothetical protein
MKNYNWWWLSYADEEKGFLGVIIVLAPGFIDACKVTHAFKINPGGQVQGVCLREKQLKKLTVFNVFKLLNKEEAKKIADDIDE